MTGMEPAELRRIIRGELQPIQQELGALRDELKGDIVGLRDELKRDMGGLRDELVQRIEATEERLAHGGRLQFGQLAGLYRSTIEKIDHLEKHLGNGLDATRGAIEALRSSIERQDFRSDELARRIAALETQGEPE